MDEPTPPAYADWPTPPSETVPPATGISNGRIGALLVGLVVLIGGGFAAANFASGGGDGPTRAVDRLFNALADEDLLGTLGALDPGERDALEGPARQFATELQRLGLASDELDLNGIAGIDITVDGLRYETDAITDDLVAVTIVGGTATVAGNPADLPSGSVVESMGLALPDEPTTEVTDFADPGTDATLVAARRGGSWYVSIGWTMADAIRREEGLRMPPPEEWLTPEGADTPEGVVDILEEALSELSLGRLMAVLAPTEVEPLYAFAPAWIADADAARDAALEEAGFELDLDLIVEAERDGDRAHLLFRGFTLDATVSDGGETFNVTGSYADGCSEITFDGPGTEELSDALFPQGRVCLDELLTADGPEADLQRSAQAAYEDLPIDLDALGRIGIEVVEVDGRWYLSPIRTSIDPFLRILGALDDDAVSWFAEEGEAWLEDAFENVFSSALTLALGATEQGQVFSEQGVPIEGGGGIIVGGGGQFPEEYVEQDFCDYLAAEGASAEELQAYDCG